MPTRTTAPLGSPCWADLWTSDVEGSRRFYGELFGWESDDPDPQFGGYFIFNLNGVQIAGGMGDMGEDMRANDTWKVYFNTDNIEKTVEAADGERRSDRLGCDGRRRSRYPGGAPRPERRGARYVGAQVLSGIHRPQRARRAELVRIDDPRLRRERSPSTAPSTAGRPTSWAIRTSSATRLFGTPTVRERSLGSWTRRRSSPKACRPTGGSTGRWTTSTPPLAPSPVSAAPSSCRPRTRRTDGSPRWRIRRVRRSTCAGRLARTRRALLPEATRFEGCRRRLGSRAKREARKLKEVSKRVSAPGRLTVSISRADNMLWVDRAGSPQGRSCGPEEGATEQRRRAAGVVQGRATRPGARR